MNAEQDKVKNIIAMAFDFSKMTRVFDKEFENLHDDIMWRKLNKT